jgi:hypothetical protein
MAIAFTNAIKAQITQGLIKTLFERAGYRVTRLGVEVFFDEIVYLDEASYKALNLPLALRYLPDLLIADRNVTRAFMLEVKFRKSFDERSMNGLYRELKRQAEYWPNAYAVILIGSPFVKDGRFHQDFIRVLPLEHVELLNPLGGEPIPGHRTSADFFKDRFREYGCEAVWNFLSLLTTFDRLAKSSDAWVSGGNADLITTTIKDLSKL